MVRGRVQDEALIEKVGWPCLWYPNVLGVDKRYDGTEEWGATDTETDSRGYVEEDPEEIDVMFLGHSGDQLFDMAGAWEKGSARGTIDANVYVADQERIIPQVHSFPYKLHQVRGSSSSDTITTPWLDEILILRDNAKKYVSGADFELTNNATTGTSTITWLSSNQPAAGETYAIKAMIFPVWRISGVPKVRGISRDEQLPWLCQLVRDDVAVRGGA